MSNRVNVLLSVGALAAMIITVSSGTSCQPGAKTQRDPWAGRLIDSRRESCWNGKFDWSEDYYGRLHFQCSELPPEEEK